MLGSGVKNVPMPREQLPEDHWKRRYEKLECRMNEVLAKKDEVLAKKDEVLAKKDEVLAKKDEVLAKKDKKIVQLEEKVNRLEGLLTNAINQIEALTLEMNSAKETAAAANARNVNAKTGKKKRQ